MSKYLFRLQYSREGLAGTVKEGFAAREQYLREAAGRLGVSVEALYWAYGDDDLIGVVDAESAAWLGWVLQVSMAGMGRLSTTPLITAADMDAAVAAIPDYRAPSQAGE